ncbi:hypothetical protein GEMRC1_007611 [Eukaryota sp. GEM-RC1]
MIVCFPVIKIHDSYDTIFPSGVKQEEQLVPFLFCLPLQKVLRTFSSRFPDVGINSYANDTLLVGSFGQLTKTWTFLSLSQIKCINEIEDSKNDISLAKIDHPAICALLTDILSAAASSLVMDYHQRFNFNLKDQEWAIKI